jgi:hypothetical protein
LLVIGFVIPLGIAPSSALSVTCSASNHCYGIADWLPGGTYDGVRTNITTTRLQNNGQPSDAITSEVWLIDSLSQNGSWVESGAVTGYGGTRRWYWAEECVGGGFQFHAVGLSFSLGTTYEAKISWNTGGKYAVYRNGSFIQNTQTCHTTPMVEGEAGSESFTNTNIVSGTAASLAKRGASSGSWSSNWGGATIVQDHPPMSSSWITQYAKVQYSEN